MNEFCSVSQEKLPASGILQKIRNLFADKATKVHKAFTLMEVMLVIVITIALGVVGFRFGYPKMVQAQRMSRAAQELDALASACATYCMFRADGAAPADMDALVTGVLADDAVDNMDHTNLINSARVTDGSVETFTSGADVVDPWGNVYEIDGPNRIITCSAIETEGDTKHDAIYRTF